MDSSTYCGYSARVTDYETTQDRHQVYVIEVKSPHGTSVVVRKRYSEFKAFFDKLQCKPTKFRFPGAPWGNSNTPQIAEQRKQAFQELCEKLFAEETANHQMPEFEEFFSLHQIPPQLPSPPPDDDPVPSGAEPLNSATLTNLRALLGVEDDQMPQMVRTIVEERELLRESQQRLEKEMEKMDAINQALQHKESEVQQLKNVVFGVKGLIPGGTEADESELPRLLKEQMANLARTKDDQDSERQQLEKVLNELKQLIPGGADQADVGQLPGMLQEYMSKAILPKEMTQDEKQKKEVADRLQQRREKGEIGALEARIQELRWQLEEQMSRNTTLLDDLTKEKLKNQPMSSVESQDLAQHRKHVEQLETRLAQMTVESEQQRLAIQQKDKDLGEERLKFEEMKAAAASAKEQCDKMKTEQKQDASAEDDDITRAAQALKAAGVTYEDVIRMYHTQNPQNSLMASMIVEESDDTTRLMQLGFERSKVEALLEKHGGDVNAAANELFIEQDAEENDDPEVIHI